jgi:hypothetical protein
MRTRSTRKPCMNSTEICIVSTATPAWNRFGTRQNSCGFLHIEFGKGHCCLRLTRGYCNTLISLCDEGQVIVCPYPLRESLTNFETSFLLNLIYRLATHTVCQGSSFLAEESRPFFSKQRTCRITVLGDASHLFLAAPSFQLLSASQLASLCLSWKGRHRSRFLLAISFLARIL